ncbi:MAG: DNA mismatch repair endonuclease MutH [Gammaproteobacteria bacterium]|nr:DNA mismatch repair endonuclease MutH [Gammaproteobacteria bacterium]MDE0158211.1 DNA mismatch repair endonuclease MutH [Gammaproteobacteria bacterium]
MNIIRKPPESEAELMRRCRALAGKSLGQVAAELNIAVPGSRARAKGWAGQLIERYLGASAASRPRPDFMSLGIELKTIPVNRQGRARESTFVCMAPMTAAPGLRWSDSTVRHKLNRVLWVPIEADPGIMLSNNRTGNAFLWSPSPEQARVLEQDWQELVEMLCFGEFDKVSAKHGKYLQIRPKAASSASLVRTTLADGEAGLTLPRGFYLRARFTTMLLEEFLSADDAD